MKVIKELIPYLVIIIIVILIRSFVVTPIRVNGNSMYPNLKDKEIMILNKISKKVNGLKRFDIVVLKDEDFLIKRVIGLPGETISCQNGDIFINGKKIDDKYGYGITNDFDPVTIPKNEYFVLGDNRENSKDSRYIGTIKNKNIKGKTNLVIFPFKSFGIIK